MRNRNAFTLIELLVVIAIIAILAAILFPVFAQAKAKAKQTATLAQQKQLGVATLMYMNDNEDRLYFCGKVGAISSSRSGALFANNAQLNPVRWWNGVMPYVKSSALFLSTSDDSPSLSPDPLGVANIKRSYIACRPAESLSSSQVEFAAETMAITEKWGKDLQGHAINDSWIEPFNGDFQYDATTDRMLVAANRYSGGLVSTFLDGHAKWLKPAAINSSPKLTGCTLIHQVPLLPEMCDMSLAGCTNDAPENVCNTFTY